MNGGTEMKWWWLSFADDDGFRGVTIVQGDNIASAAKSAHRLGINPGGQVLGFPMPPEGLDIYGESHRNRLLSREDLEAADGVRLGDLSEEQQRAVNDLVCDGCNE